MINEKKSSLIVGVVLIAFAYLSTIVSEKISETVNDYCTAAFPWVAVAIALATVIAIIRR